MDESTRQAMRLWTLAQPTVSAFVASVVRDFGDRDDVLQETAVAVIESFDRYDPQRPFVAWALGVARNQIGLYLRKRRRERLIFDDATIACLAEAFADGPTDSAHRLEYLGECLQLLGARAAELCQLRYHGDLKPAAIADRVGMSANAVAKALQRIREQLRDCIQRRSAEAAS